MFRSEVRSTSNVESSSFILLVFVGYMETLILVASIYVISDCCIMKRADHELQKPVTAITILIERLTKDEYGIDDTSDLPTLIEAIRLQSSTGPTEAARALRKKL